MRSSELAQILCLHCRGQSFFTSFTDYSDLKIEVFFCKFAGSEGRGHRSGKLSTACIQLCWMQ